MGKRSYGKKPLEWKYGRIGTVDDTVTKARIELGLKDDEVAEIHKIDTMIDGGSDTNAVAQYDLMLSMDPDAIADPSLSVSHDDLEVFYEQRQSLRGALLTSGQGFIKENARKVSDFPNPILVGTDVGMVVKGHATITGEFTARLYFTRRKANVMELNQILLKRR